MSVQQVWSLPQIQYRALQTVKETRPVALLTHPDWGAARTALDLPIVVQAEPNTPDRAFLDHLAEHLPTAVQVIYALGDSPTLDAAKYVASKSGRPAVLIPTLISSSAALRPDIALKEAGMVVRLPAASADSIIIDLDLVRKALASERVAAYAELIAMATALMDWGYAAQKNQLATTPFVAWAAGVAANISAQAIKLAPAIGKAEPEAIRAMLALLSLMVALDNQLGHHRASHGAEHLFADSVSLNAALPPTTHSERLGAGILLTSALHNKDVSAFRAALEQAGIRLGQVKSADVLSTLLSLPDYAKKAQAYYTILSDLVPQAEQLAEVVRKSTLSGIG
jgi:glycerol dehydrogenase-like iron-containing ADH family enzyme